ncbi:MAG: M28 family peptidase [Dehalococcoidia bacterium]|nr:M28 family peptidase [Dehalococcoidia bacterium]
MEKPALEITTSHVERVFDFTNEVVEQYPNRLAGTEACRNAANHIKKEFTGNCDPDSVQTEDFTVHPKSFLKYIPGLVTVYFICSVLLYFQFPLPALIGYSLGIFAFYSQFVRYWEVFDPLFPRATGYNVFGSIEPEGEVKQQVIISAHHDAAYVFQLIARFPRYYAKFINAGVLFLVLGFLVSLIAAILTIFHIPPPGWAHPWVPLVLLAGGIFLLPLAFFTTGEVSPAAGDNMIAVAIANETAKLFHGAKQVGTNPLRHTRLMVVSFDAEEAGLRGARAFCRGHGEELLDTKTYVLNIDTLYKVKDLSFLDRDLNSSVSLSHEMAQDCVGIAELLGYPASISKMPFGAGSTDAAEFGKIGVEATNMAGISFDISQFSEGLVYHTSNDLTEHIELEMVEAALKIARDYVLKKDSEA